MSTSGIRNISVVAGGTAVVLRGVANVTLAESGLTDELDKTRDGRGAGDEVCASS